jgi:simple sugar transport system ATP-binding protein
MTPPLLSLRAIRKRFGATTALAGIHLDLAAGEIHAVLGENGAGKSTLMNLIAGIVRPDAGDLRIEGQAVRFASPRDARDAGIGMVHQHFTLFAALSVAENLALSTSDSRWRYNAATVTRAAADLARRVGLKIDRFDARVDELPVGTQQRLEILKALAHDPRVLILDEPTAVLTPAETRQLFSMLQHLRDSGRLVLFITHKLREAKEIADRVTILRHGRVVGTYPAAELTEREMAEHMVGEATPPARDEKARSRTASAGAPVALRLARLNVAGTHAVAGRADVSFEVRGGEIFGIGGVDGNGQRELFESIVGLRVPDRGEISVHGRAVRRNDPRAAVLAGIAHIPPDRQREGLILPMTVLENFLLSTPLRKRYSHLGVLQRQEARRLAADLARLYDIRTPDLDAPAQDLSGGNQQRIVVARELAQQPAVLVAANPTRGLDIAAARAVSESLLQVAARGCAILLISTDLDEILDLSDRFAILSGGSLSDPLEPPVDAEQLGLLMSGAA